MCVLCVCVCVCVSVREREREFVSVTERQKRKLCHIAAKISGWLDTDTHAHTSGLLVRELQIAQSVAQQGFETQRQKVLIYTPPSPHTHSLTCTNTEACTHTQGQTVLIFFAHQPGVYGCLAGQHRDTHILMHIHAHTACNQTGSIIHCCFW